MIKLKVKTNKNLDYVTKFHTKKSNIVENIIAINSLIESIMENENDMNIDELLELIKKQYLISLKEENNE